MENQPEQFNIDVQEIIFSRLHDQQKATFLKMRTIIEQQMKKIEELEALLKPKSDAKKDKA